MGMKYTLRFRAVNKDIFLDIKSGKKTVETGAGTERYRNIKAGDMVILVCGKERLEKEVKKAKIFKTIKSLIRAYPIKKITPHLSTVKELEDAYHGYSNYKLGSIGLAFLFSSSPQCFALPLVGGAVSLRIGCVQIGAPE